MNKKKVFALALAVCVLAIVSFSTLAWFTDADSVTNEFTVGSIEIDLVENFDAPTAMLPIVNVAAPSTDVNYVNKDAWVENKGMNPAYVQVFVAVPQGLNRAGAFHFELVNTDLWVDEQLMGEVTIGTNKFDLYRYRYNQQVEPGAKTKDFITGAYLDHRMDYNKDTGFYSMNGVDITDYTVGNPVELYVYAQAVQAQGFSGYTVALDSAFGDTIPQFR
jgi:predicted ribosomally synthesized peptide with SipW-like signal peptide